jgi:hypothetical protein
MVDFVQELGKAMGMQTIVFNCGDALDHSFMASFHDLACVACNLPVQQFAALGTTLLVHPMMYNLFYRCSEVRGTSCPLLGDPYSAKRCCRHQVDDCMTRVSHAGLICSGTAARFNSSSSTCTRGSCLLVWTRRSTVTVRCFCYHEPWICWPNWTA